MAIHKRKKNVKLVTQDRADQLHKELASREGQLRIDIANKIEEAKKQGDLSENAAYIAALEEYQLNESKIDQLRKELINTQVVSDNKSQHKVQIGSKVLIKDVDNSQEIEYTIGGDDETDPSQNKISVNSPIGASLLGKKTGDITTISLPIGEKKYKILQIK